jgi:phytoene/squalene synthetase
MSSDFAYCAELVRRHDYDRFLSALFAPEPQRARLLALYAFNYEVAKTAETVSQPLLGQMRLQWWREALDEIYAGDTRRHEVVAALAVTIRESDLPRLMFDALLEARELDLETMPLTNMAEMEAYADATSGHLMRLAARVCGAGNALDGVARDAGIAFALTGILRALPWQAAKGRVMLPRDYLLAAGLSESDVLSGRAPALRLVCDRVIEIARRHWRKAHDQAVQRRLLPALLPAALTPAYLRLMQRGSFDWFRDRPELSLPRRQLALFGAMMRARV